MQFRPGFLVLAAGAAMFATPASANYMGMCEKLISTWDACMSSSASCAVEEEAILTECKCHERKGDDWLLVMAAVAETNVCGAPPPTIIDQPPPPNPQPGRIIQGPPPRGAGGEEVRGEDHEAARAAAVPRGE